MKELCLFNLRVVAFVILWAVLCLPIYAMARVAITTDTSGTTYTGIFDNYALLTNTNPARTVMTGASGVGDPINKSVGRIRAAGTGMHADGEDATNEGSIYNVGDNTVGMRASVNGANTGTAYNSGTIYTNGTNGYGMSTVDAVLDNSGSIESIGTGAHAIYASGIAKVYLREGTRIIAGDVFGGGPGSSLYLDGAGVADFGITGTWGGLIKSGAGTWTLQETPTATLTNLTVTGGTLELVGGSTLNLGGVYTQNAGTVISMMPGDSISAASATITGSSLMVAPTASMLTGATTVVATTGGVTGNYTVSSSNPFFSLTSTNTGNQITVDASYTPQWDNSAIALNTVLEGVQQFVLLPTTRSLFVLASAAGIEDAPEVLVASVGLLDGLLSSWPSEDHFGFYIQPMYGTSEREVMGTAPGYSAVMTGLEMGADMFVTDDLLLGFMGGYSSTFVDYNGSAFVDSDSETQHMLTVGPYLGYRDGPWRAVDTLSLSYISHTSDRNAGLGETAEGSYHSWLLGNRLLGEYVWNPAEHWELAPQAGLNVSYLYRESFTETGAANAVAYDAFNDVFYEGILGLRTARTFQVDESTLTPNAGLTWTHAIGGNDVIGRQTLGATAVEVTSENDDDRLGLNLGLKLAKDNLGMSLDYMRECSEHTESQGVVLSIRLDF